MRTPTAGPARIARAAAFGITALTISAGAHLAVGGPLPSLVTLLVLAIPLGLLSVWLTIRRCGPLLLAGALGLAQVALHEGLMLLSSGDCLVGPLPAGHAQHWLGSVDAGPATWLAGLSSAPAPLTPDGSIGLGSGWSSGMVGAHVAATLVLTWLLSVGEQALWRWMQRIAPTRPGELTVALVARRDLPVGGRPTGCRPTMLACGAGVRGPPSRGPVTA